MGGGMIGSAVAMDLARQGRFAVTVADKSAERLDRIANDYGVATTVADLSHAAVVAQLARTHDLVIGALPSVFGFQALQAVLESGRPIVDISFMPENALELDGLARSAGVAAVIDCGVAPGLSSMMAGSAAANLTVCERVVIYVGGLPVERRWPFEYQAGFSPSDVIEEYVRPARVVEHGRTIIKDALTDPELIDVPGLGTLEAFVTDGLRSLPETTGARSMTEKTLRYPGHRMLMHALRESGFFSKEPVDVRGQLVAPLDVTAALLFPKWAFQDGEADITVMRVIVEGADQSGRTTYQWDLIDRYDPATRLRSMSRTTAFPASIVAGLVADGALQSGVHPPETIGRSPTLIDAVLRGLDQRGVRCQMSVRRESAG